MKDQETQKIARRRFLKRLGMGACLTVLAEAGAIEPYRIEVTRHTVYLPDLPHALEGMLLAQLTDIHHGPITPERVIRKAVRLTMNARPDIVLLTGDFIHHATIDAARLAPLLTPLRYAPLGLHACLDNHAYSDPHHSGDVVARALTEKAGVRFLRNENKCIAPGLHLAGIEDTLCGKPDYDAAFHKIPKNEATIFLTHNPVGVLNSATRSCLALSGHTHGGQIRIPGLPPHFPPGMKGFPLIDGWGIAGKSQLYISRGVGMGGVPLRFLCHPEVALFELRRGTGFPRLQNPMGEATVQVSALI